MNMLQIGILGVIGALLAIQFKSGKSEYGIYVSIGISIVIFSCIITRLEAFTETIRTIQNYVKMDTAYIATILKMIGVTYIAEFSAGVCKDAGYQNIAIQIEIFGKLTILALSMPILLALMETIQVFLS